MKMHKSSNYRVLKFLSNYKWIILATMLAILLRSIPAWINAAWGNDLGIYYGITTSMIKDHQLFIDYNGWGSSYQFFPLLYVMAATLHVITGLDIIWILPKIAPIIGGLTVIILYFIALELSKDRKVAILSAFLLAVAPFHVYQTSHAAPLTVGHFFMLLSMYLFIRRKKRVFLPFLALSTFALILSHHLTTYFYIISISGIILWRNINSDKRWYKGSPADILYISTTAATTFIYWSLIAKPVYYKFMSGGIPLKPWQTVAMFYIILYSLFLITTSTKKIHLQHLLHKTGRYLSNKAIPIFAISAVVILSLEFLFIIIKIPGTKINMTIPTILLSIPLIAFVGFSAAGLTNLEIYRRKYVIEGWLLAILLSLTYALIKGNTVLYPDRHIEYLMVPMSLTAASGIVKIFEYMRNVKIDIKNLIKRPIQSESDVIIVGLVMLLILSNAVAVYPSRNSLGDLDERITQPCMNAIHWMEGNVSNSSVIASDHRLSMLLWAEGFNITMGKTNLTWTAENWTDCLTELKEMNISYILIDDIMRDEVINVDVGKYYYMSNESYEKFSKEPFELVYRNATLNNIGEEIHWAEVYSVNMSYINNILLRAQNED